MAHSISKFAIFTIISNNVKTNRENILDNIQNTVYSEFATVHKIMKSCERRINDVSMDAV